MSPLIILIAAFVGVTALVGGVAMLLLRNPAETAMEDRLAVLTGTGAAKAAGDKLLRPSVLSSPLETSQSLIEPLLKKFTNINRIFVQADTSLTVSKFLIICAVMGVVGAMGPAAAGWHISLAPVFAFFMSILPMIWLSMRRKRRLKMFAKQLPDALELMSRALRAGHSLAAGFNLVASEMSAPMSVEMGRVFEEQNLGIPLDEALESLTERIPNLDLRFFATAVILQRQTGGDLAEILDKIGHLVRERFQIWGQVQALTGEGRLSGIVLLALPPGLFCAVYKLNPEYVMPLFTDPMGQKMLAGGIVMQLLGAIVIRKIVNIRV